VGRAAQSSGRVVSVKGLTCIHGCICKFTLVAVRLSMD
jgi:hypothetical protein